MRRPMAKRVGRFEPLNLFSVPAHISFLDAIASEWLRAEPLDIPSGLILLPTRRAARSLAEGCLPLGLAHRVTLKHAIEEGAAVRWSDVEIDDRDPAVRVRREMEAAFARPTA